MKPRLKLCNCRKTPYNDSERLPSAPCSRICGAVMIRLWLRLLTLIQALKANALRNASG